MKAIHREMFKPSRPISIFTILFCLTLCFFCAFAYWDTLPKRGVINDEGVELLQAQDLPFDKFYFFAPNYHGGHADLIEAFVPYVNAFLQTVFGRNLLFSHLFFACCHCLACYFFFLLVAHEFSSSNLSLFAMLLLGTSSYPVFFNRILTRNGISLMWTTLLMLLVSQILKEEAFTPKIRLYLLYLPLAVVLSLLSYTSFKFLAAALYISLGLRSLFSCQSFVFTRRIFRKKIHEWVYVAASAGITVLLLSALLVISQTPIRPVIFRGGYVLGGSFGFTLKTYISHLIRSLLLPIYFSPKANFLVEVTHSGFSRHTLPLILAPFWLFGCWEAIRQWRFQGFRFSQFCLLFWISSVALLAVGGPQLKHQFAIFPVVVFLSVYGWYCVTNWLADRFRFSQTALIVTTFLILLIAMFGEIRHLTLTIPTDGLLLLDAGLPYDVARQALTLAEQSEKVYIIEGWGRDALRYYTRHHPRITYLPNQPNVPSELLADIQAGTFIALVHDGDGQPPFLNAANLMACFTKDVRQGDRWSVSVYILEGNCSVAP